MNVRPKTVRRLAILAAGFVLIIGALASVWAVHQRNKEKRLRADRDFGIAAFHAGDWQLALARLGPYKDAHPEDYDALYAYAYSRSRVPAANGRHYVQAKQLFEQLNHARPSDLNVSRSLLDLYLRFNYNREAIDLADSVLARKPDDTDALRAKALALRNLAKVDDALAIAEKLNEVAPTDAAGQRLTFELLCQLKRPPADVLAKFEALRKAHPDDPQFDVLLALASDYAHDRASTLKWLRAAATRPSQSAAFVEQLSQLFDRLGLFDESQALLERASAPAAGDNSAVLGVLVQRLWQNGRFGDVVTRLANLEASSPKSPADLLAIKAMSLHALNKPDDADTIVKALDARKNDATAQAWAIALRTRYDAKLDARTAVANYEKALARDRDNAIMRSWIAESYLRLGEIELALGQWRAAASLAPSWSDPFEMASRALLAQGRELAALAAARDAMRRGPMRISSLITLALAWNAYLQDNPIAQDTPRLLALVSEIQKQIPGEPQTLPIYVSLQATKGRQDLAIKAIEDALKQQTTPPEALVKLLAISRAKNLGLDQKIQEKIGANEDSSASLAYAHAVELARSGNAAEGLEVLSKAAASATTQPVQWQMALARYRDATNDPAAKDAWIKLGDQNANDVAVQSAILMFGRAARGDRDFIGRTIERARKLTGDEGQLWRLAKARWLLSGPNKDKDSSEAVTLLSELVRSSPDVAQYRILLAAGLKNLGNTKDATDHLRAAAQLEPGDLTTVLDLVRLLQAQGNFDDALDYLNRAARNEDLTPSNRTLLARMMAAQGATQQALDLLKAGGPGDPAGALLAAELARGRGQADEAAAMFDKLLADPAVSADAVAAAAEFYASRGNVDAARAAVAKMSDPRFPAWQRAIVQARFDEFAIKDVDAARKQYLSAVEAAPTEVQPWRLLAEFEIRQAQWDAAVAAIDRGLEKIPNDPDLADLKTRAAVLRASADEKSDLAPMIETLAKDPATAAQADLLRAVQATRTFSGKPDKIIEQIKPLAEKHPNSTALQQMLVRQYVAAKQLDNAAKLAEQLIQSRPGDPGPAELATGVYQIAARWRDMKRSADLWRERSLANPLPADLAAGEAMLNLKDANGALDRLAPYIPQVKANPAGNPPLTAMLLRAMIGAGQSMEARQILDPLLTEAPAWRLLALSLAGSEVSSADTAADWIRRVTPLLPPDSTTEKMAMARAWQQVYIRLHDPAAAAEARQALGQLAGQPDVSPAVLVMLGSLDVDAHDFASAEKHYRRALELQPNLPEAQNNLAYLMLERGENLEEAKRLATSATAASPNIADFFDTLARVNLKLGRRADAINSFEAALKLDPRNLQSLVGLAGAYTSDGKRDKASELLKQIDAMLDGKQPTSTALSSELQSLRDQLSRTTP